MPTPDLRALWVTDRFLSLELCWFVFWPGEGRGAGACVWLVGCWFFCFFFLRHVILSPANTSDSRNKYIPAPGAANLPPRTGTASLPLPRDRKPPEPRGDPPPPSHRRETGVSRSEPRERSPPGKRCGALRAAARPTLAEESSEKLMAAGAAGPVSPGKREPPLSSGQRNVNRTTGSAGEPLCAPPPLGSGRGPS